VRRKDLENTTKATICEINIEAKRAFESIILTKSNRKTGTFRSTSSSRDKHPSQPGPEKKKIQWIAFRENVRQHQRGNMTFVAVGSGLEL
jgi:hypothetical protein